jgi:hypothetical protein
MVMVDGEDCGLSVVEGDSQWLMVMVDGEDCG